MAKAENEDLEFDVIMNSAGLKVPADRRTGTLAAYRELKRMAELLRQPRDETSEPAAIFSLEAILREE